jgi:hypothetical protein
MTSKYLSAHELWNFDAQFTPKLPRTVGAARNSPSFLKRSVYRAP